MSLIIRHEKESDYRLVEEVCRDAFWNLYFPGCAEHLAIHKIRKSTDFIKELSFVLELDGKIIGGIFYTKSKIIDKNNKEHDMISFGPVFIHPDYHRKGFGRKLITHSIEKAKDLGYKAILTLGYDYHYSPYGFVGGKKYDISMEDGKFYKGLLVLPLYENALKNISGYVLFSDSLESTEKEIEEFDSTFPYKEKQFQESQKEYELASTMLDE